MAEKLGKKTEKTLAKRLEHRLFDIVSCLIDGKPIHNHREDNTSPDNKLVHSYFYSSKRDSVYPLFRY